MDTGEVWTSIIIPIVIGPIFIYFKSIYDRFNSKNDERKLFKFNDALDRIKNKLSKFYWPVYIKLLCIYQFNFNIPLSEDSDDEFSSNSSVSSTDDEVEPFIKYTKKKLKKCKGYYRKKNNNLVKCRRVVPNNSIQLCRRCKYNNTSNNLSNHLSNNLSNNFETKDIPIIRHKETIEITMPRDITDYSNNTANNLNIDYEDSFTGHGIGIVKNLDTLKVTLNEDTLVLLKNILDRSYREITEVLESNISIAEPNSKLGKEIISFIKYSKIRDIIESNKGNYTVKQFGAKDNTNKLLGLIEIKVFDLQKAYNLLLKKGPYDSSSDSD